jgi:hypothetical protein
MMWATSALPQNVHLPAVGGSREAVANDAHGVHVCKNRETLKRCQVKIVCLVLGSSDPDYRTKQMEVGDTRSFGHESADRDSVP